METKFTKRVWQISPIHPNQIVGDVGTGLIATVSENRMGEWEANAKLIAAAPELLEALKSVLLYANCGKKIGGTALEIEIISRIKKATE